LRAENAADRSGTTESSLVPALADAQFGQTFRTGAMDASPAQSLKPKAGRRASAGAWLRTPTWTDARWRRGLVRWGGALMAFDLPRGAGSSAAALLLLASTCYGVVKGGHTETIVARVQDICDTAANSAGFRISEIALAGQHEVSRESILTLAGITGRSSLLFLDASRTRARLMRNPWIADAAVLKLYPGRLRIEITERKPFALWQKAGLIALIAADGIVLERYVAPRFAPLPLVVGDGAEHAGHEFIERLNHYPQIASLVEASVLVADRRWNLHLKGGIDVLLPEGAPDHALKTLAELERSKQLLARDIATVDLRLPDRVTVRLSDGAAAARDDALKAAEKNKKKKGKGGEA
jgi:cell division protein FtsQ